MKTTTKVNDETRDRAYTRVIIIKQDELDEFLDSLKTVAPRDKIISYVRLDEEKDHVRLHIKLKKQELTVLGLRFKLKIERLKRRSRIS